MRGMKPYILSLLMLFAGACGLLDTREPEQPKTGTSTFVPPTSADLVIANLESAVAEKNTENYMRCLPDSLNSTRGFHYLPTAAAAGRYPTTFAMWSLQSERSWFSTLEIVSEPSSKSSLILAGDFSVLGADSAIYEAEYTLRFKHGVSGVPETVKGHLQFVLTIDRNFFWSITRWIDNPLADQPSWSEWKGRFAN